MDDFPDPDHRLQADLNFDENPVRKENNAVTAKAPGNPLGKTVYGSGKGTPPGFG